MRRLGLVLPDAVGREEVLRAAKAWKVLRDWENIVGQALGERSMPDRYDHGTVWVAVQGSAWAQELRMSKELILTRLNERAKDLFNDLRFGVRPIVRGDAVMEVEQEDEPEGRSELSGLSIREIAERRLQNWKDGGA